MIVRSELDQAICAPETTLPLASRASAESLIVFPTSSALPPVITTLFTV
jgi:hypothetical protein